MGCENLGTFPGESECTSVEGNLTPCIVKVSLEQVNGLASVEGSKCPVRCKNSEYMLLFRYLPFEVA